MRHFRTEGIVLKRRDIGEADRLLTILTPTQGKLFVKAPGVRRITSRRSSHIEPFTHAMFTLYKGKGTPIVTEVHTIENFSPVRETLSTVGLAYHLCELVDGLCPEGQEQQGVFSLLKNAFVALSFSDASKVVQAFEIDLLKSLGFYTPTLQATVDTSSYIEQLLERKLKTRRMLYRFG